MIHTDLWRGGIQPGYMHVSLYRCRMNSLPVHHSRDEICVITQIAHSWRSSCLFPPALIAQSTTLNLSPSHVPRLDFVSSLALQDIQSFYHPFLPYSEFISFIAQSNHSVGTMSTPKSQYLVHSNGIYHGLPVFPDTLQGLTAIVTGANGISGTYMVTPPLL